MLFLSFLLAFSLAGQPSTGTIKGVLTDNSGAIIPAAPVSLTGNGVQKTAQTQADGSYTFTGLAPGEYTVHAVFPGFSPVEKKVTVAAGSTVQVPIQLTVTAEKQEVTVSAEAGPTVSVEPDNNATALVLKGEDLSALPDDPDDLADALQALAGPGAGPNGGSIYIDGFSGGELPPKESIREIRINQNPFSAEFDRLGYGRIEILTKPGFDKFRGSLFFHDSDALFNSRNPLVTNKPDFSSRMFGGNVGGPLNKHTSFFMDFNRRQITDNTLVTAQFLDPATLAVVPINQAYVTPNTRTEIGPRLDWQISTNHTLTGRFQYGWNSFQNRGIGGYNLPPPYSQMAYDVNGTNLNLTLTETAVLSPKVVNETRFQYARRYSESLGNNLPTIAVSQEFSIGGNQVGNAYDLNTHYELQNYTSIAQNSHTIRVGVRLRRESVRDNSPSGYAGTFLFNGAVAPVLDASNQPVVDPATGQAVTQQISALEQYRRTLLFQGLGYGPDVIRQLGGGASQFTISAGNPYASIFQYDVAPFVQDDWKLRPNLTLSLGLRYEIQTNLGGHGDFAPRVGFAWAPGSAKNGRQKTVIRGGFGIFYDRVGENLFLQAARLNGSNQLSYVLTNPDFFPNIPTVSTLTPTQNTLYRVDSGLRSQYMIQSAIGVERQLPRNTTASVTFTNTRGLHLSQSVPINTPLPGTFIPGVPGSGLRPFGDIGNLFLYESGGLFRQNMFLFNVNSRISRNLSLNANYTLNYAHDLPGTPTDPYDFALDWGRSSLDRRHRFQLVGSWAAPLGLRLSPFVILQSGAPYDITLGRDIYGNTLRNARPAFADAAAGVADADIVHTQFGDFLANPLPGSTADIVPRNYLTAAGMVSVNLRIARTFGFGEPRGGNAASGGGTGGGRGFGGGGDHGHGGGGGGMRMGPMGGGRGGMFGDSGSSEHRYNLTLSTQITNVLNHYNPANYEGVLGSTVFGTPRGISTGFGGFGGGSMANNRRIELQLRLTF
ncbi:MAG TPA: carboxypeptidase regulatory-like domain-containing protein [Bryobacteraceae bacterium]